MNFKLELDTDAFAELVIDTTSRNSRSASNEHQKCHHHIHLRVGEVQLVEESVTDKYFRHGEMTFFKSLSLFGKTGEPAIEIYISLANTYRSLIDQHSRPFDVPQYNFTISYSPSPFGKCIMVENETNRFFELTLPVSDFLKLNIEECKSYNHLVTAVRESNPFTVSYTGIPLSLEAADIISQIQSPHVKHSLVGRYLHSKLDELVIVLFDQCDRYALSVKKKTTKINHQQHAKVIDYLRANYMNFPTLDEIAKEIGTSRTKLCLDFKNAFNCSIFDYCNKLRLTDARNMLKTTDMTVAEIAFKIGYQNRQHFSTAFKRYFGYSPSEFKSGKN